MLSIRPIYVFSHPWVSGVSLYPGGVGIGWGRTEGREGGGVDATQLKRIPLFWDASEEELRRVAVFAQAKEVAQGDVVVEEGGYSRELLAMEDGTAEET